MRYLLPALTVVAAGLTTLPAEAQRRTAVCMQPAVTYAQPVQKIVAQDASPALVTVPVASQGMPVEAFGASYYYTVNEAYREKAYLREVIREELRAVIGVSPQQPAQPYAQPPAVLPSSPATTQTAALRPDDTTPPDLQAKVLAAFQGRAGCINCHGPNKGAGGLRLALADQQGRLRLVALPADKKWKIYGMATSGMMPPTAVNDAAKIMESVNFPAILQWASVKTPND